MSGGWSFHNPVKVQFGPGTVAAALGRLPYRRMLLVTSAGMTHRGTTDWVKEACRGAIQAVHDGVLPNPEMADLDALAARHRNAEFDAIIALGGGSVLDTGKVLGILLGGSANFTLRAHFLENCPVPDAPAVPVIAVPTTAGTGSEVTPFSTVWDACAVKKYSLAHIRMFPIQAFVDPELTKDLPWNVTLATGLDALCQALESTWNRNANPITLGFSMRAAKLAWEALQQGEALTGIPQSRANLMEASLLAGLAISHTRTALCHSMSYPVTARLGLAHGLACGFTMPAVLRFNTPADDGRLMRLAQELALNETGELADALAALLRRLGVRKLVADSGAKYRELNKMIPEMITPGRTENALRVAGPEAIGKILTEALFDLENPATL